VIRGEEKLLVAVMVLVERMEKDGGTDGKKRAKAGFEHSPNQLGQTISRTGEFWVFLVPGEEGGGIPTTLVGQNGQDIGRLDKGLPPPRAQRIKMYIPTYIAQLDRESTYVFAFYVKECGAVKRAAQRKGDG
jgi:hypothetical protein